MYKIITFLFLLLINQNCYSQTTLKINFSKLNYTKITLTKFFGLNEIVVDSIINSHGLKKAKFKITQSDGFYRIKTNDGHYVDFIKNKQKNIQIEIEDELDYNSIISKDKINGDYFKLQAYLKKINHTLRNLNNNIQKTVITDSIIYYESEKLLLLKKYKLKVDSIVDSNKNNYLGITAQAIVEPNFDSIQQLKYKNIIDFQSDHFFDKIDFSDPSILNSTVLPNLFSRYFGKYVQYDEPGFQKAVDIIMNKSKNNQLVYEFSLDFLINLFSSVGPEIILEYIVEKYYTKEICGENNQNIQEILKLLPGNKLKYKNYLPKKMINNKNYNYKAELNIFIFWSIHCNYCLKEITQTLLDIPQKFNNKVNLFMVHIDQDSTAEKNFYKTLDFENSILLSENQSWDGPFAKLFRIKKTPMIYILDKEEIILTRSLNVSELNTYIDKYLK